jgi:thioredoxin-like negative regulator of GroEL
MLISITARALVIGIAAGIVRGHGVAAVDASIRWEVKLDRATAAARETNRPILIEFWATWCEPCREMDRDVYGDERIVTAMGKVQPLRIDIDREPGVTRKYDVTGTPTLLVTDSLGRELFRYAGALPLDRMRQLLESLPADVRRINELSAAIAARKDDYAALRELGQALRVAAFYRAANDYNARALKTHEGRRRGSERTGILLDMARNALELRLYADATRLCELALREAAGSPAEAEIRALLSRALAGVAG